VSGGDDLRPVALAEFRHRRTVAGENRLERLLLLPVGMFRRQLVHPVEREHRLRVQRMRHPQRAVLIEGGDAILGRHEARAPLVGRGLNERDDRLLRRAVVPRGEGIVRRLSRNGEPGNKTENQERTNLTLAAKSHRNKLPLSHDAPPPRCVRL
jgi:hypothetical protein